MSRLDDYIVIGDVPEGASFEEIGCGSGYCLSFRGPLPRDIELRPLGSGIVIPSGWMAVSKDLVSGLVIPSDPDAAMLRVAVHLARSGAYFSTSEFAAPNSGTGWAIEVSRVGGDILYLNSLWLMRYASSPDLPFSMSSDGFRPMVVSGNISWATKAVYDGYACSLSRFGINVVGFEYDGFMKMFSEDMVRKILTAEFCNVENGITHLIVIDGMSIPSWVIRSARRCGIVTIMISTEDPHCVDATRRLHPHYDYVFSNDKNAAETFGVHYLPVAGDDRCFSSDDRDIDVLFVGAIYPNRMEFLEGIVNACVSEGISIKVVGPFYKCSPHGVLGAVADSKMISTEEYINLLSRSKVCINIFRDENCNKTGFNSELGIPAYSLSPRCYDAPLCGSMLITDYREEVADLLGEECLMGDDPCGAVVEAVKKYELKKGIIDRQRKNLKRGHLYAHRAACLLSAIGKGFLR